MKNRPVLIAVGAAVLLTILWYFMLYSPQSGKIDEAKQQRTAEQQRESELAARLTRLKNLEANAVVLERERARFLTAVPDTDRIDEFIIQVNERAADAGVRFVSVAPAQPGAGPPAAVTPISLQMQVQGDYFAILRFMEALRDGPRLVVVDNFSLSGQGGDMSASIGGRMFISAGAAAPLPGVGGGA